MSAKKIIPEEKSIFENDVPPTFYDKVNDNLKMDLEKLINNVVSRYLLLKEIESLTHTKKLINKAIKIPDELSWSTEEK